MEPPLESTARSSEPPLLSALGRPRGWGQQLLQHTPSCLCTADDVGFTHWGKEEPTGWCLTLPGSGHQFS